MDEYRYRRDVMLTLKIMRTKDVAAVLIPEEMLGRLKVQEGDILFALDTPDGYLLTPSDPALKEINASNRCAHGSEQTRQTARN